jgi:hypothetical protein
MRALIAVMTFLGVAVPDASASPPSEYACDRPDVAHEKCKCDPGQHSVRDRRDRAICMPDAPERPERPERCDPSLYVPALGAEVDTKAVFVVRWIPGSVEAIRIEICADEGCAEKLVAREAASWSGTASIEIADLPRGSTLYWRVMCRAKGKLLETHSAISSFRVVRAAPPEPPPSDPVFDLQRVDAAIAAGEINTAVMLAAISSKVADHLEVARRLVKAGHCADIERVLGLRADPEPGLDGQVAQLRSDCTSTALPYIPDEPTSSRPSRSGFDGLYAATLYRMPLAGARTAQGMGYQFGGNGVAGKDGPGLDLGPTLVVTQPQSDSDGRAGNLWQVGLHIVAPGPGARPSLHFVADEMFGGGRFLAADNRHGVATFDVCLGTAARLSLAAGFGLGARGMGCGGVMFDVSHFGDSNNPEQGRWHGTMALDLGVMLDWVP